MSRIGNRLVTGVTVALQQSQLTSLLTAQKQTLDSGNTKTIAAADAQPANPWVGEWTTTRSLGVVAELVVISASSPTIGGIFIFQFSEDGVVPTVSQTLPIGDFATVRDVPLVNAGEYFRVTFEPAAPLGLATVFVTTTLHRQYGGLFVRLANQEIEEANAAMGQTFAYLKAFSAQTGKSINLRPTATGALVVRDEAINVTQSGSTFVEGIRDDVSVTFATSTGAAAIAGLVDFSVGGTVAHVAAQGQAEFAVPAVANQSAFFTSELMVVYESGHTVRGEQTIEISALPTGTGFVEWGFCRESGGAPDSSIGYRLDAGGLFVQRRKNGVVVSKVAQADWNRDRCDGAIPSRFTRAATAEILDPTKNNVYRFDYEWLGISPPSYFVVAPNSIFVQTHVEESPNSQVGSTVPDPEMAMYVLVQNDGGAQALTARSGAWRGGLQSAAVVIQGLRPNQSYGRVPLNEANSLIVADFLTEVSKGNVPRHELVLVRGHNPDIDPAASESIISGGGTYVWVAAAGVVNLVSTSALDTAAGTGARTVRVSGLSAAGVPQTEVVILNGVVPVPTVLLYLRVHGDQPVITAGLLGANQGVITGLIGALTVLSMPIGNNVSEFGVFTVPAGHTAKLLTAVLSALQNTASATISARLLAAEPGQPFRARARYVVGTVSGGVNTNYISPLSFPAGTDLVFDGAASANNTIANVRADLLLIED
jgi:hypothetical protein